MNLFVLDKNLDVVAIVDVYTSLIWTDRYQEYGDFELHLPVNKEQFSYLRQGYYLWRNDSEHVMIIEKILLEGDPEEGDGLSVTGRSLESILDRRVIWGLKTLNGNFQDGVETLMNECIISPSKPERKIENFVFEKSTDTRITDLTIDTQYTGDNLYDTICALCKDRGIGFKVTLNDQKQFVFKLYSGDDRSYDQFNNPYVVFSPNFDNLINSNYMESDQPLKNVTLVGGEGEGKERRYTAVGNAVGLNRREIFTDARDISSDSDDDLTPNFVFTNANGVTLTNLVPTTLNTATGWSSGGTLSSAHAKYGSSCMLLEATGDVLEKTISTTANITLDNTHKYYVRVEVYQEVKIGQGVDIYWPISEPAFAREVIGNPNQWNVVSTVTGRTAFTNGSYPLRLDYNNNGAAGNMWFDGVMLIDLTACFGAGNEPTKEWLDENIPWFEKTYTYTVVGTTPYPNQVYNATTKAFVTDNNFNSSMVDISRYAGRTISITVPKYNIKTGEKTDPDTEETVDVGGVSPYATILVDSEKKYVSTLLKWEAYDEETANRGSLDTYEILLPLDAQYIYTSMYSQAAIDAEVYYGDEGDFECQTSKLSNAEYITLLRQRGSETLADNTSIVNFEGEAETTMMYKYGIDFFMGDIVDVEDDYGHRATARVLELVMSDNEDGSTTTYPTFSMVESAAGPFIPEDYTVLDYLKSSGTQWIDTDFYPDSNTRVVMDTEVIGHGTDSDFNGLFGVRASANREDPRSFSVWYVDQDGEKSFRSDYYGGVKSGSYDPIGKRITVDKDKNVCSIGDTIASANGYVALEYIESTGTQWIDTGVFPTNGYSVTIDFQLLEIPIGDVKEAWVIGLWAGNGVGYRAGVYNGAFETARGFTYNPNTPVTARTTATGNCTIDSSISMMLFAQKLASGSANNRSKARLYSCKIYNSTGTLVRDYVPCKNTAGAAGLFDAVSQQFVGNNGTGEFIAGPDAGQIGALNIINETKTGKTPLPLYLLTCNSPEGVATGSDMYNAIVKLYSCKIYDNGVLVRNMVPVRHRNGLVGLYDVANQTFYGNSGTGSFINLPEGYTELEYIQSTGTQWIDTGFKPNQDTRVVLDFEMTEFLSGGMLYGTRQSLTSNDRFRFLGRTGNDYARSDYGSQVLDFIESSPTNLIGRLTVDQNKNVTTVGEYTCTHTVQTFSSVLPMALFAANLNTGVQDFSAYKLYHCMIYDNTTLVREYVPCRNPNGEIGLFEVVNQEFYTNAGTGSFIAGEKGA